MEVEAHLYYWTAGGMVRQASETGIEFPQAYLMRLEVEKLLEEAHRRGFEAGEKAAASRTTRIRPG